MSTRKLVDPAHLFDTRGDSVMTKDHLLTRIAELESKCERLEALLAAQVRKNQALAAAAPAPETHH